MWPVGLVSCAQLRPDPATLDLSCLLWKHPFVFCVGLIALRSALQLGSQLSQLRSGCLPGGKHSREGQPLAISPMRGLARFPCLFVTVRPVSEAGSGPQPLPGPSAGNPCPFRKVLLWVGDGAHTRSPDGGGEWPSLAGLCGGT